jgi:hypothetical protein
MNDRCWHNKFHPEYPQCPSLGTWHDPHARGSSLLRAMRWCDAHKHDYDVQVQEHACEYGILPCPQCGEERK